MKISVVKYEKIGIIIQWFIVFATSLILYYIIR